MSEIEQAVKGLGRSEQGRQAMADLLQFLENSGLSLDGLNQQRIALLLAAAWGSHPSSTLDALRKQCR